MRELEGYNNKIWSIVGINKHDVAPDQFGQRSRYRSETLGV